MGDSSGHFFSSSLANCAWMKSKGCTSQMAPTTAVLPQTTRDCVLMGLIARLRKFCRENLKNQMLASRFFELK